MLWMMLSRPQDHTEKRMTMVLLKVLCDVIYPFQQYQWVLSKKWVNGAIFSSHCAPLFTNKQRLKYWMKCHTATLNKYSGEIKVFDLLVNGVNYLSGFKLHLPVETRSCVRAWNDWEGGSLPPGLALINWGVHTCLLVSICFKFY